MAVTIAGACPCTSSSMDQSEDADIAPSSSMAATRFAATPSAVGATKSPSHAPTPIPLALGYPTPSTAPSSDFDFDLLPPPHHSSSSYSPPSLHHQLAPDINDPTLEDGDQDSGTDSPIEPVTPVSGGRHPHDLVTLHHSQSSQGSVHSVDSVGSHDSQGSQYTQRSRYSDYQSSRTPTPTTAQTRSPSTSRKAPLLLFPPTSAVPAPHASASLADRPTSQEQHQTSQVSHTPTPALRRTGRSSTSNLKRTMSRLFRRSNSALEKDKECGHADGSMSMPMAGSAPQSSNYLNGTGVPSSRYPNGGYKSSTTTRSSSPPSPGAALELVQSHRPVSTMNGIHGSPPEQAEFSKKNRASTGLTLRGRAVNFVGNTMSRGSRHQNKGPRRASSFDMTNRPADSTVSKRNDEKNMYPPERLPWAMPPEAGTGVKARRMSLSLPDDFTVDVAELLSEFEYQSKLLGRHGKHLGKGAASKVTLMVRKGCPGELYAVKEFRGKSHRESQADYEKKIKSEFSIGKSLHHPNIVETVRLCTDHGRWNHVMEYCAEGDLFGLVQKGFLKGEDKKKDRLCLFKQLVQGVNYLHANGIAHRDIKLENLLMTKDSKLKITDFGVSEVFSGTHPGLRESGGQCGQNMGEVRLCSPGICGSEPYIAPEVLEKKHSYDARALDVWGSAIVMIYLTFGGAIWSRAEAGNLHYDKLVRGWDKWYTKHPECDACITDTDYPNCYALDIGVNPPALRRILLQMLNPDPSKRISMSEVVHNRWMKNVECCQLESYEEQAQMIDATKKDAIHKGSAKKIYCHSHLPPKSSGSHSLGKMPGQPGY
ncbi:hypothetical protein E4U39_000624 [Claviceps sp. Clav50 group G5]|nr:hypothetical protein E4U39_000624 [Claviceps sp. Clav50 group G5]